MKISRLNMGLAGAFFLIAIVTSIYGGTVLDARFTPELLLNLTDATSSSVNLSFFMEMINALCVLAIAILFYPVFSRTSQGAAAAYLSFRILESLSCSVAAAAPVIGIGVTLTMAGSDASEQTIMAVLELLVQIRAVSTAIFSSSLLLPGGLCFLSLSAENRHSAKVYRSLGADFHWYDCGDQFRYGAFLSEGSFGSAHHTE